MFSKKNFSLKNLIFIGLLLIVGFIIVVPGFTKKETKTPKTEVKNQVTASKTLANQTERVTPTVEQKTEEPKTTTQTKVQGTTTQTSPPVSNTTPLAETPVTKTVTLNIETGSANYSYKVNWSEEMTVYQILDKAHTENNFSLKSKWYGGSFNSYYVTGIHNKDCECWEYKVNGEKPSVGASITTVNENDIIIWKAT